MLHAVLAPEAARQEGMRARYTLTMKNGELLIELTASDFTAFKAAWNSLLRQVELSLSVHDTHG